MSLMCGGLYRVVRNLVQSSWSRRPLGERVS